MFKSPIPILRSFDEQKAKEFYVGFLGFAIDWEHRFEDGTPLYMQLSCGECVLHLTEHFGDASPGAHCRIAIDNVPEYCQLLNEKHYRNARPAYQEMSWGTTDMSINDPFGNKLTFYALTQPSTHSGT